MVGTQAVANIIAGERYKVVLNEVKAYVLGKYGRAPAPIDEAVKQLILENNPSSEKESNTYLETKEKCLAQNMSQEDMLIHVTFPQLAEKFFAKDADPETDGYKFTCTPYKESGAKLVKTDKLDDDVIAVIKAILASQTKKDAGTIQIKNIYTYSK